MSANFKVSVSIDVRVTEKGTLELTAKGVKLYSDETEKAKIATAEFGRETSNQAYLVRRLSSDLRMMTIGLLVFRRELGGLGPAFQATVSGLLVFSSGLSIVVGTWDTFRTMIKLLPPEARSVSGALEWIKTGLMGVSISATATAIALAALAGVAIGTAIGEWVSGISNLRTEIDSLKRDLESLQSTLDTQAVQQASLSEQTSYYQYWLERTKREVELQGFATQKQTSLMQTLEGVLADSRVEQSRLNMEAARSRTIQTELTRDVNERERAIKRIQEAAKGAYFKPVTPAGYEYYAPPIPEKQLGGEIEKPGYYFLGRGEVYQREQIAERITMGGPVLISGIDISFPNATITNSRDVMGAMREGGARVGEEMWRKIEILRRGSRSR